jgi:hypothetical protein
MVLTYPMECYVSRHCMLSIIKKLQDLKSNSRYDALHPSSSHSTAVYRSAADQPRTFFDEMDMMGSMGDGGDELLSQPKKHFIPQLGQRIKTRLVPLRNGSHNSKQGFAAADDMDRRIVEMKVRGDYKLNQPLSDEVIVFDSFVNSPAPSRSPPESIKAQINPILLTAVNGRVGDGNGGGRNIDAGVGAGLSNPDEHHRGARHSDDNRETWTSVAMRTGLTLILWGSTLFIALVIEDVGVVISLTGAFAASCLGYILPALIYFQTYKSELRAAINASPRLKILIQATLVQRWLQEPSEPASTAQLAPGPQTGSRDLSGVQNVSVDSDMFVDIDIADIESAVLEPASPDSNLKTGPKVLTNPLGSRRDLLRSGTVGALHDKSHRYGLLGTADANDDGNTRQEVGNEPHPVEGVIEHGDLHGPGLLTRVTDHRGTADGLGSFILPAFLLIFGILAMFLGVGTVIWEHRAASQENMN